MTNGHGITNNPQPQQPLTPGDGRTVRDAVSVTIFTCPNGGDENEFNLSLCHLLQALGARLIAMYPSPNGDGSAFRITVFYTGPPIVQQSPSHVIAKPGDGS